MNYKLQHILTGEIREVEAANSFWAVKKSGWQKDHCFIRKVFYRPVIWPDRKLRSLINNEDPGPLFKKGGD